MPEGLVTRCWKLPRAKLARAPVAGRRIPLPAVADKRTWQTEKDRDLGCGPNNQAVSARAAGPGKGIVAGEEGSARPVNARATVWGRVGT